MDSKVAFLVNVSFIFAMLLATSGHAQYSTLPCTAAPSPRYNLQPCADRLTTVCRDELFGYIFEHHEAVRKECCIELVKMGRWCHNHLTFATIRSFVEKVPELEARGDQVWELCDRESGIWSLKQNVVLNKMLYFLWKYYIFLLMAKDINAPYNGSAITCLYYLLRLKPMLVFLALYVLCLTPFISISCR